MDEAVETVAVTLTVREAMTVVAALRQYEPYWSSSTEDVPQLLATIGAEINSVIGKLRVAAG